MKLLPIRDCSRLIRHPLFSIIRRQFFSKQDSGGLLQQSASCATLERYIGQPTPHTHEHLLKPGEITPGISGKEYKDRRLQLMSSIKRSAHGRNKGGSRHVVIVLSANTKYMSDGITYPFRQNTDFLYLCGLQEPDSVLVLESLPGCDLPEHKSTLFVRKRDPDRELWDGPRAGIDGALQFIGVDEAYTVENFNEALHRYSVGKDTVVWYDALKSQSTHNALHQDVFSHMIKPCINQGHSINNLEPSVNALRVTKSPAECDLMRKSASLASKAFTEVMSYSQPGINESALYAKIDFECRIRGAEFLAYPPVVAGGDRANTLHYIINNQIVQDGEMVLMDAGCEYHGYGSDITRTWPVNGKYTGAQAELYEAVLSVQKECIDMCRIGTTLDQINSFMLTGLGQRLQDLGIVSKKLSGTELYRITRKYCPHHVGHYLGMDIHDTPQESRSKQLQPGMVITIEPGLYFPMSDLSAPARYRGIGIRIEDDILITAKEPDNLSEECPKEMRDIEDIMARR